MQWLPWSEAETAGALFICCATGALAFFLGRAWVWAVEWAVALGVLTGLSCTSLYLVLAVAIETFWPTTLDARSVGIHFAVLCVVAPLGGGIAAYLGRRF